MGTERPGLRGGVREEREEEGCLEGGGTLKSMHLLAPFSRESERKRGIWREVAL